MNITLIRHPQTTANKEHVIYGKLDYPYTNRGHNQLEWLKEYMSINYGMYKKDLGPIKLISSPRGRAAELAKAIGEALELIPQYTETVSEMDFGIFEGLTIEEALDKYPEDYKNFQEHFDTTSIPEGESYEDFIKRMDNMLAYLEELIASGTVEEAIIISHGGVVREMVERLLDLEPGGSWKFMISNGCIVKMELHNEGYRLKELIANKF